MIITTFACRWLAATIRTNDRYRATSERTGLPFEDETFFTGD